MRANDSMQRTLRAGTQGDRDLRHYDAIIIDEAHERSLNIDFLLGYLKQLLPRRPDLKLVVTSATIDAERFSRHFGRASVIEVSGRLYSVEVRYRPLAQRKTAESGPGVKALKRRRIQIRLQTCQSAVMPRERRAIPGTSLSGRRHSPLACGKGHLTAVTQRYTLHA